MKSFFYFSKSERRIILLLLLIFIILMGGFLTKYALQSNKTQVTNDTTELVKFMHEIAPDTFYRADSRREQPQKRELTPFTFDPNKANRNELLALGLPEFIVNNLLHYREKGGRFRTPQSFAKLYGLTHEQFATLLPYIRIDSALLAQPRKEFAKDSIYPQKLKEGIKIDLNTADTTLLKKVPGIGSGLARLIVAYRNRLGGFVSTSQLQEIPHVPESANQWFFIGNELPIRRLHVNTDGLDRLRQHPYMDFYKARIIIEYRRRKGNIKGLPQLSLFKEFSEKDLQRLRPYLDFD